MAINNSLTQATQRKVGFTAYLTQDGVKKQIANVLGGDRGQKFIASIVSAVNTNPALQDCTNSSIVSGALLGASLNLTPSPQLGQFYLVPFNDKDRGKVAQFVLGYHGMLQLAIRSGQYKKINVLPIKAGELVRFDPIEEEIEVNLIDDEEARENAPTIGYYAAFEYTNGFRKAIYWSRNKMEKHAERYSKGYAAKRGYTFWEKDFDAMACKTMLRQLLGKWGAMDTDLRTAYESDGAVINTDGTRDFVEVPEVPDVPAITEAAPVDVPVEKEPEQAAPADDRKEQKSTKGKDVAAALFGKE